MKSTLAQRDLKYIWRPFTQMKTVEPPIGIVRGEKEFLFDEAGKQYIDAVSSWWVNLHGHSHPYIAEKISEQVQKLEHVIFAGFTHEPAVELAERLLEQHLPQFQKLFYSDNGSTTVEVGVKLAMQYWFNLGVDKKKVIAFKHAYHGDTFGAMAVGERGAFNAPFHPFMFAVHYIDPPTPGNEEASIQQFENLVQEHRDIGIFIFEPLVQGAGGMIMHSASALDQLIQLASDQDIITVADEVMTGFGRTGKMFAIDYLENSPDIICLSKGITGGTLPLAVTACTQKIFDAFLSDDHSFTFFHGHSYTANPICCVTALASLDLLEKKETWQQIKAIEALHEAQIENLKQFRIVSNIRRTGVILAIEFRVGEETSYFSSLRDQLYHFCLSRGVLLRPLGNVLYILPPYCIQKKSLAIVYQTIETLILSLEKNQS